MKDDQRPGYLQVADDLRQKIASGVYEVGRNIPSTAELITIYGVSSTVVRAAVNELRIAGIVRGLPGKGVQVQQVPSPDGFVADELTAALDDIRADLAALNGRLARVEEALQPDVTPKAKRPAQTS